MKISFPENSTEFKSSMHWVCKHFLRTYCGLGIFTSYYIYCSEQSDISALVKFAFLQESNEDSGKEGNGGVTGEMKE